jgi:hypothetical protein
MNDWAEEGQQPDDELNAARRSFLRLLREARPDVAELYEAGQYLAASEMFTGRGFVLAHVVRELRRLLPSALSGIPNPPQIPYPSRLGDIERRWARQVRPNLPSPDALTSPDASVAIPLREARSLDQLMRESASRGPTLRERFLAMCRKITVEPLRWAGNSNLVEAWMALEAHHIAHLGSTENSDQRALDLFAQLDSIVLRIFQSAPEREARILTLAQTASPETVVKGLRELVTLHDHFVFYGALRGPEFLQPLRAAGAFTAPADDEMPTFWPPADYLATIASVRPREVAEILVGSPTKRPGTIRQLLRVALSLPDAQLVRVLREAPWVRGRPSFAYLHELLEALSRCVNVGEVDLAFSHATRLLQLKRRPPSSLGGHLKVYQPRALQTVPARA